MKMDSCCLGGQEVPQSSIYKLEPRKGGGYTSVLSLQAEDQGS